MENKKAKIAWMGVLACGVVALAFAAAAQPAWAASCSGSVPVYRLYQYQYPYFTNDNFYTTNPSEKSSAIANLGYKDEGVAFYAFNIQAQNTVPVYRLFNKTSGDHFYTTSGSEKDDAVARSGYAYEGVGFYAFSSQVSGSVPVYRLYENGSLYHDHFYTIDASVRDSLVANSEYTSEGTAFYAYPTQLTECGPAPVSSSTMSSACTMDADCGITGFVGGAFCQNNGVYRDYRMYTCNNPGASNSYCSNSTQARLQESCTGSQICAGGSCLASNQPMPGQNPLQVSCSPSVAVLSVGQQATYSATVTGGTGSYSYNWSGACSGGARNCTASLNSVGTQTAVVRVTSGSQTQSASCSATVSQTCVNGSCNIITNSYNNGGGSCSSHSYRQCVGNAVYWFNSCGQQQDVYQPCSYSQTCQGNSCVSGYSYPPVPVPLAPLPPPPFGGALALSKEARNLSAGNLNWSNSVYANPSDTVQFEVAVQNNSGQPVDNVTVRDAMPQNLYYQNNLTMNGAAYGGDITQGLNIGSVLPGQTVTVDYQAQVAPAQNFAFGSGTLTNSATVTCANWDSCSPASASAQVQVTRNAIYGATAVSTGLTGNFLADSFFLPLVLALAALWLLTSGTFRMPAKLAALFAGRKGRKAQQRLEERIAEIRNREIV